MNIKFCTLLCALNCVSVLFSLFHCFNETQQVLSKYRFSEGTLTLYWGSNEWINGCMIYVYLGKAKLRTSEQER